MDVAKQLLVSDQKQRRQVCESNLIGNPRTGCQTSKAMVASPVPLLNTRNIYVYVFLKTHITNCGAITFIFKRKIDLPRMELSHPPGGGGGNPAVGKRRLADKDSGQSVGDITRRI